MSKYEWRKAKKLDKLTCHPVNLSTNLPVNLLTKNTCHPVTPLTNLPVNPLTRQLVNPLTCQPVHQENLQCDNPLPPNRSKYVLQHTINKKPSKNFVSPPKTPTFALLQRMRKKSAKKVAKKLHQVSGWKSATYAKVGEISQKFLPKTFGS